MNLPKYLHANESFDDDSREFVLHTQEPKILIEFKDDHGEIVIWFDDQSDFISRCLHAGREPIMEMARILREAGDFYLS